MLRSNRQTSWFVILLAALIGGNDKSLMAGGPGAFTGFIPDQLSALDIAAARAVYGSSLNAGASRADFVQAGLIAADPPSRFPTPMPVVH